MLGSDERSYEEVINQLRAYQSKISEAVTAMDSAGRACVENTDNDPAAETSYGHLRQALNQVQDSAAQISGVISALQRELEDIQNAASIANRLG